MKRGRTSSYKKAGPYKRTRNAPGSSKANAITIPDSQVKRILNTRTGGYLGMELKFRDYGYNAAIATASDCTGGEADPFEACLNGISQGDGQSNRDGRKYTIKSVNVKGTVRITAQTNETTAITVPSIFIALVQDKQTNGAQLNSEDVFVNPSAQTGTAAAPFVNLEFQSRFNILKTVHLSSKDFAGNASAAYDGTNLEYQGCFADFSLYKAFSGLQVTCTGTTGNIASIMDNSLHIIAFSTNSDMTPLLTYNSRVRFMG